MNDIDDTTMIRPPSKRRPVLWTVVGILGAAAILGGVTGAASTVRARHGAVPTATPSVSYSGTWRIIRVPGVQTGVHVPDPMYTTPPPKVITKTVAVPGPTVTVPGPTVTKTVPGPAVTVTVTVRCTQGPTPDGATAPVCTTSSPTP